MNIKKHFTIALFYSVLTLGMFFGLQYIFAWTNPASSPPSGNISPPINEGTTAQVKDGSLGVSGNLTAPIFYDVNNTGYYIDPAGTSKFSSVNLGGVSRSSWSVDTDTRCDSSGQCSQVCVGSDCRGSWPSEVKNYAASEVSLLSMPTERNTTLHYWVKIKEFRTGGAGTFRFKVSLMMPWIGGIRYAYAKLQRNGADVGSVWSCPHGTGWCENMPQDIGGWSTGDIGSLWIRTSIEDGHSDTTYCKDFGIFGSMDDGWDIIIN